MEKLDIPDCRLGAMTKNSLFIFWPPGFIPIFIQYMWDGRLIEKLVGAIWYMCYRRLLEKLVG